MNTKNINGSDIIMECLIEQGVDTVFGYPGGAVLNIYDALYKYEDKIKHVLTSHEQGAAHAADGYARSSGKVGVCIATSGPGATNLVTGIATAYMDSVPMVAITGNVGRSLLGLDSFQEVDITGITMSITKHNFLIKNVEELADTVREAFVIANSGRKGPVLIDIPKDITGAMCDFTPVAPKKIEASAELPPKEWLDKTIDMLKNSKRPMIYAGGGVMWSGATDALHEFADKLDAPVSCSLMCQGGFDQENSRYVGMLGMHGTKVSAQTIKHCDLLIAVGSRFSDRVIGNQQLFAKNFPVIQIDVDAAEFNKNIPVSVRLKGDAKVILEELLKALPQCEHGDWMNEIETWKNMYPLVQKGKGVTPQSILSTLSKMTNDNSVITTEVGQHQMWTAQYYTFRRPQQMLTSGGLGTMGYGLGASIGAKFANPTKKVINIAGDGSFHMNLNELATASKYNVPIIEMIFDNQVLGMVRQWQKLFYDGRFSSTTLEKKTDYEFLAKAFGIKMLKIEKEEQIESVLKEALSANEPVLIHCVIDKDFNVLPMVPTGASVEDPILEM